MATLDQQKRGDQNPSAVTVNRSTVFVWARWNCPDEPRPGLVVRVPGLDGDTSHPKRRASAVRRLLAEFAAPILPLCHTAASAASPPNTLAARSLSRARKEILATIVT